MTPEAINPMFRVAKKRALLDSVPFETNADNLVGPLHSTFVGRTAVDQVRLTYYDPTNHTGVERVIVAISPLANRSKQPETYVLTAGTQLPDATTKRLTGVIENLKPDTEEMRRIAGALDEADRKRNKATTSGRRLAEERLLTELGSYS